MDDYGRPYYLTEVRPLDGEGDRIEVFAHDERDPRATTLVVLRVGGRASRLRPHDAERVADALKTHAAEARHIEEAKRPARRKGIGQLAAEGGWSPDRER